METNFNFKSAICTSKEQSERLLTLGLKKETADCNYPLSMIDGEPCQKCPRIGNPLEQNYNAFPAWSLLRLIEMVAAEDIPEYMLFLPDAYNEVIAEIENCIKNGWFNKEYLV